MMTKHEVTWTEIAEYGDCAECGGEGSRATQHTHDALCDESVCNEYADMLKCSDCSGTGRADWTPEMTAEAMQLCEWYTGSGAPDLAWSPSQTARNEMALQVAHAFAVGQCQTSVAREAFQALLGVES